MPSTGASVVAILERRSRALPTRLPAGPASLRKILAGEVALTRVIGRMGDPRRGSTRDRNKEAGNETRPTEEALINVGHHVTG